MNRMLKENFATTCLAILFSLYLFYVHEVIWAMIVPGGIILFSWGFYFAKVKYAYDPQKLSLIERAVKLNFIGLTALFGFFGEAKGFTRVVMIVFILAVNVTVVYFWNEKIGKEKPDNR